MDNSEKLPVQNLKENFKPRVLGGDWSRTFLLEVCKIDQPPPDIRARHVSESNVTKLIESMRNEGVDMSLAGTVVVFEDNFRDDFFIGFRDVQPCDANIQMLDWSAFYAANPVVIEGSHRLAAMKELYESSAHKQSYRLFSFRVLILKKKTPEVINSLIKLGVLVNKLDQVRSEMTDIDLIRSMHEKLLLKYPGNDPNGLAPYRIYLPFGVSATEQELMKQLFGFRAVKGNAFSHLFQLARFKGDLWDSFIGAVVGPRRFDKYEKFRHWTPFINAKGFYDNISSPNLSDSMRITICNLINKDELSWKMVKVKAHSLCSTAGIQAMIASFFNLPFSEVAQLHPSVTSMEFLNNHIGCYLTAELQEKTSAANESRKVRPVGQWTIPGVLLQELQKVDQARIPVSYCPLQLLSFPLNCFFLICF